MIPAPVIDPSFYFTSFSSSAQCVQWVAHDFAQGPLRFLLMHLTADPQGVLEGTPGCRALACARCVLRSGVVYGIGLQGPSDALVDACCVLAAVLPQYGYDESFFSDVDREIANALQAAGYGSVRARLEHNAATRPRPVVAPAQVERLMLAVVNRQRVGCGDGPLAGLTDAMRKRVGFGRDGGMHGKCDPAVIAYENVLDVHARNYMASTRTVYGNPLDRLAVYNFIAGRAGKSRYRVQALRTLPWILPLMTAPERGRILREVVTIRAAIDEAEPLHDAVARAFDVSREVVRWLSCRTLPEHWQLDDVRLRRLLAALSWIPPERRPQSPTQFGDLVQLCGVLARIFRFRNDRGDLRMSAWSVLHGPCMRLWMAECQHGWALRARCSDPEGFATECADASDFLSTLVEAVQDGQETEDEAALALVMRWAAGISLRRLLDLSRQWHANAFRAVGTPADEPDVAAWPAILPEAICFGEVTAVELTSAAQLRAEGSLMQHCVASYDRTCYNGRSAIVSLRAASGAVLSTAELRLVGEEGLRVTVEQHRSVHNGAPGLASQRALAALILYLNDGASEPLLRARNSFQQRHRGRARLQQREREAHAHQVALQLARGVAGRLNGHASSTSPGGCKDKAF
jgi:hypothetical protein